MSLEALLSAPDMTFLVMGLALRCQPVLVPTMPPGGSAADIGVNPCNHRVGDIHLRGHLIARFAFWSKISHFHCGLLGTFVGAVIALTGSHIL